MEKEIRLKEGDDLFELVQEWKPYLKIAKEMNQKLCLVIDNKNTYLSLLKEATTGKSCVERLLQEKAALWAINVEKDRARIDGLQWAQNASFGALIFVLEIWENQIDEELKNSTLVQEPDMSDGGYGENLYDYFEDKIFISHPNMYWGTEEFNEYIPVWLSGVNDYMNLIEEKFDLSEQGHLLYSKLFCGNQTK
ncbi:hypothetical protein [Desulfobacula sp.]|jgi:hypothetical protein|uniref:hypothetical protein n=1 Tax=Desulfobacula sp. TaxID=2593537 RepID=UPI0039B989D9|nr:hypothetical protein [Desulfobacula sp.]